MPPRLRVPETRLLCWPAFPSLWFPGVTVQPARCSFLLSSSTTAIYVAKILIIQLGESEKVENSANIWERFELVRTVTGVNEGFCKLSTNHRF